MKKIKDIASGDKYVPWETLAGSIDDNFTELNNGKLDKNSVAQNTGTSTTAVMSQKAVTDALELSGGTPVYTNYLTCSTAASAANKTVNILGFTVNNKVRLLIKMTYATTVDANLAISAPTTVTKPLYYNGKRAGASNTWKAGAVLDIYYDGTNFQATDFISQGGSGGSDKTVHVWSTGDLYLSDLDPVATEEDQDTVEIENILGLKPKQLYDYALESTVIIHDTPFAQEGSVTKFGCVALNYSLCDLGGKGSVEENPGITESDYIELTYAIGPKVYNYKLWFNKVENLYTGITDAHVTNLESGICLINGLSANISNTQETVTKEDVESWFGSSNWRDIYYRIKGKVLADYSEGEGMVGNYIMPLTYLINGDSFSESGGVFLILVTQHTAVASVQLTFKNGEFSVGSALSSALVLDAPSNGKSYMRKNGDWVEYTAGVNLSTIMAYSEEDYSNHKSEILSEYDRIVSLLKNNNRVISQISIDGPIDTSIGSSGNEHIAGPYVCDVSLVSDTTSGSNLDRLSGIAPSTTGLKLRLVYINRVTRDVQVIDKIISY